MNTITITGNATMPPELKFLNSGQAVARLNVAVNKKWQNRQTQEWEEKVSFFTVNCFGQMAENVANSVEKGSRVTVSGELEQRSWETEKGEKRTVVEIKANDVALSLAWAYGSLRKNDPKGQAPKQTYQAPEEAF